MGSVCLIMCMACMIRSIHEFLGLFWTQHISQKNVKVVVTLEQWELQFCFLFLLLFNIILTSAILINYILNGALLPSTSNFNVLRFLASDGTLGDHTASEVFTLRVRCQ